VLTSTDPSVFSKWANRMLSELKTIPHLADVSADLMEAGPMVRINVDQVAAGRLGVTKQDVNNALYNAFGQRQISTIFKQANQYRVVLEADPRYQTGPQTLESLYVPGTRGQVPLKAFATIERTVSPLIYSRVQKFPAATISFNLAPGASLDTAVEAIEAASKRLNMPSSMTGRFQGTVEEFTNSLDGQPWLILAAVIVIYIVLGVLYESFIHPFTILTTLPSAGIGALLALELFGIQFTFVALIGIILLMGIVKKNAIIMIDFALDAERNRGLTPFEAIREACSLRFRPIMMTTFAALFGAVPLAIGTGAGSELRVPLGITIIGGLLLSQLLTLYTTPVIYLAMERLRVWLVGWLGGSTGFDALPRETAMETGHSATPVTAHTPAPAPELTPESQ
jgi:multidrug efflux pump